MGAPIALGFWARWQWENQQSQGGLLPEPRDTWAWPSVFLSLLNHLKQMNAHKPMERDQDKTGKILSL